MWYTDDVIFKTLAIKLNNIIKNIDKILAMKLIKKLLLFVFFNPLFLKNNTAPNIEMGITLNFRCSHTLSFTGVKIPTKVFLFEASYAKCSKTP